MQTEFENGDASDLILHASVEVEGKINNQGQLVAEDVEFIEVKVNE